VKTTSRFNRSEAELAVRHVESAQSPAQSQYVGRMKTIHKAAPVRATMAPMSDARVIAGNRRSRGLFAWVCHRQALASNR
jgi:hypothetical protein